MVELEEGNRDRVRQCWAVAMLTRCSESATAIRLDGDSLGEKNPQVSLLDRYARCDEHGRSEPEGAGCRIVRSPGVRGRSAAAGRVSAETWREGFFFDDDEVRDAAYW